MSLRAFLIGVTLLFGFSCSLRTLAEPYQSPNPQGTYKIGGDVVAPKLIHQVEPKFPRNRRTPGTKVTVLVGLSIDVAGKPYDIHIVRSVDPDFDKASLNAVAKYRFKPATLRDKPVPVEVNIDVQFQVF